VRARCSPALAQACAAGCPPGQALLCVRPERLYLCPTDAPGPSGPELRCTLTGQLCDLIHQGDHWRLIVQIEAGHADPTGGTSAPWVVKLPPTQLPPGLAPGQHIRLGFRPDDAWAFVPEGAAAPGS
jgi:hypothetical protein